VLRITARSEAAALTQFRQLLDLLGSLPPGSASAQVQAAYQRLEELAGEIPATVQSRILRTPDLRLRSRALVAWLATQEPQVAAAAMATARLSERDWLYLIPRFPMAARGFLRHRRDLPASARQVLARLGVRDLVLPEPVRAAGPIAGPLERPLLEAPLVPAGKPSAGAGIGAIVRRIEAFQRARREGPGASAAGDDSVAVRRGSAFDFATDAGRTIVWADRVVAPLAVGMTLGPARPGGVAEVDADSARALQRQLPISGGRATLLGPPAIAGQWRLDATPTFDPLTGAFTGHVGRMRRVPAAEEGEPDTASDRMRQVLHELRTPVNAIQGFAEIIQQQLFGAAPNEYRALAAGIAVDAARLLAGFEELDRLAQLEANTLELAQGSSDLREVVVRLLRRLEGVLRPRNAGMALTVWGSPFTVPLEESEALRLAWRLLATLAGAVAPGEVLDLELESDGAQVSLRTDLPAALREAEDLFAATEPAGTRAVSAGMFGSGFAFRLARAEARAIGGSLTRDGEVLRLELPALTASAPLHSVRQQE
jgi:signal transduction histidine kinase